MTDITPENVARMLDGLWEDYTVAATGYTDHDTQNDLYDIDGMNEAARAIFDQAKALSARLAEVESWREDPESNDAWCAGNQFALDRLCHVLKVDPASVDWDGSDGSLTEEADSLIWRIVQAHTEAAEAENAKLREVLKLVLPHLEENARWHRDAQSHAQKCEAAFAIVAATRAAIQETKK